MAPRTKAVKRRAPPANNENVKQRLSRDKRQAKRGNPTVCARMCLETASQRLVSLFVACLEAQKNKDREQEEQEESESDQEERQEPDSKRHASAKTRAKASVPDAAAVDTVEEKKSASQGVCCCVLLCASMSHTARFGFFNRA
jgi:hypothetical protein